MHRSITLSLLLVVGGGSCGGDDPVDNQYDFSGFVPFDLTGADSRSNLDATIAGPDLAGYDLTCDPAAPLASGDPTGTWQYIGICASPDALYQLQANCPTMSIDTIVFDNPTGAGRVGGSLSLRSNGTFSRITNTKLAANASIPASCTQPFGGCSEYGAGQTAQLFWLSMTCQTSGSDCRCSIAVDMSDSETGTWQATPAGFTTTGPTQGPQEFSASATANTLRHRGTSSAFRGNRGITYVLVR